LSSLPYTDSDAPVRAARFVVQQASGGLSKKGRAVGVVVRRIDIALVYVGISCRRR